MKPCSIRAWVLVLVRERWLAKSRLAGVLGPGERISLQDAMLADVLEALSRTHGLAGVAVCSPDGFHRQAAVRHRAAFIEQPPSTSGMNGAAEYGASTLAKAGATLVGILPADLPCLDPGDVTSALDAAMNTQRAIVIPDRHGQGTNGLFFHASDPFPDFRFGPGSFHVHLAGMAGRATPMVPASFGSDIDTPADIEAFLASDVPCGVRTRAVLAKAMHGRRKRETHKMADG